MSGIHASVGVNGTNRRDDVIVVQQLLKSRGYDTGGIDGLCGDKTVAAIRVFQTAFLSHPDGRVDPGGCTWRQLLAHEVAAPPTPSLVQWSGDSARWPEEKKLQSMHPRLREKVQATLTALKQRGFQPKVFYGWRSVAVQLRLYEEGNSKVKFSFHNAQKRDGAPNSYAADIVDVRYAWAAAAGTCGFWNALGDEAKKQGLYWGGDWSSFRDWAHVQLVANSQLATVKAESGL